MTAFRALRTLIVLISILASRGESQAAESIGQLLLNPETRAATTYECLRRDPKFSFFADKTLDEFQTFNSPLHVLPCPAIGKPNGYIVMTGRGTLVLNSLPLSAGDDDIFAAGRLHLGRERALLPRADDRKSTRLNSSHSQISYAVFCLKKKKKTQKQH